MAEKEEKRDRDTERHTYIHRATERDIERQGERQSGKPRVSTGDTESETMERQGRRRNTDTVQYPVQSRQKNRQLYQTETEI